MIELLGLQREADQPVESLSLGRGRLVELGRALMTQPKLLLLDEPSSGLDVKETAALAERLAIVQQQHEFAVLLVEHDVEMVQSLVTRLYVLDFGTMIAVGTDRRRAGRRARAQGLPRGHRVTGPTCCAQTVAGPLLELRDVEAELRPVPVALRRLVRGPRAAR